MALQKTRNTAMPVPFSGDRRDRRPGTHFAAELGAQPRRSAKADRRDEEPRVDEDLGCCEFGIDLPFLRR